MLVTWNDERCKIEIKFLHFLVLKNTFSFPNVCCPIYFKNVKKGEDAAFRYLNDKDLNAVNLTINEFVSYPF